MAKECKAGRRGRGKRPRCIKKSPDTGGSFSEVPRTRSGRKEVEEGRAGRWPELGAVTCGPAGVAGVWYFLRPGRKCSGRRWAGRWAGWPGRPGRPALGFAAMSARPAHPPGEFSVCPTTQEAEAPRGPWPLRIPVPPSHTGAASPPFPLVARGWAPRTARSDAETEKRRLQDPRPRTTQRRPRPAAAAGASHITQGRRGPRRGCSPIYLHPYSLPPANTGVQESIFDWCLLSEFESCL
jgi:hypothetical protein